MKSAFLAFSILISICTSAQNEDKVLFEKGMSLQYAHYETDLIEMMLSKDSVKSNSANKIVNQLQKQAIEEYEELIEKYPKSDLILDAQYYKAEALYSMGRNSQAKETFLIVYSINPYKVKTLIRLARLSLDEKKYAEALKFIEEWEKTPPRFICGLEDRIEKEQVAFIVEKCKIGLGKN